MFFNFIGLHENTGRFLADHPNTQEALKQTLIWNVNEDEIVIIARLIVCLKRAQSVANHATGVILFIGALWACSFWMDWSEIMPMIGLVCCLYLIILTYQRKYWDTKDWGK